ncbi:hypothetical protein [Streptomyces sp. CRN 30]|uniref:hypothetical protein n=1 Tax=Streptomyces sp. CRN 30 TaxID=3075613 RepID=UPI002A7F2441|nr:hypothetical protein [Streptomyces sp. CRN 30]
MNHVPALASEATVLGRERVVGAGRRTGWVLLLAGVTGWLASFRLALAAGTLAGVVLGGGAAGAPRGPGTRPGHPRNAARPWYALIGLLVLTRFWPYWSGLL